MSTKSHSETSSVGSKIKKNPLSKMSDDGEDEVDDKGVIKRKSRNLSEKKRRDQFNVLINELCSMVCTGKRKMDKSTVLKSAISFIRNHNQVAMQSQSQEVQEDWKPSFLSNEEFTHLMLEALDGFIMVFASTGKILYVSENITCLLGHVPNDLIGTMIYDLVWDDEQAEVQSILGSWQSTDSESLDSRGKENHLSVTCHLRRGNSCGNDLDTNFELVSFSGYYRIQGNPDASTASRISSSWCDDSKGSSSFGDALSQYNGLVFVASARLQTPQLIVEMSLIDVSKSEFTSRHSLEWKFLFLDHRGPPIIGYLPFEVLGTSGYDYYHIDDLEKVSACHEALMQKGEGTSCCYRFLTKGQQWIWLQTKYYITYHQWNSKPEFIVCSHRVVSHNEVLGHPVKEAPATKSESRHSCVAEAAAASVAASSSSGFSSSKSKSDQRLNAGSSSTCSNNNVSKSSVSSPNASNSIQPTLSNSSRSHSSSNMGTNSSSRERSKHGSSKYSAHQHRMQQHPHQHHPHQQQHQHQRQQHQTPSSGASDSTGESGMLLPPPAPPSGNDTMAQHSRHPSGSSRGMGAALSDTGSISSSGSFQSAASQHSGHSRQSDQSMQSLHSQQSHHSMQSVHSQHSSQHSQSMRPNSSSHSCSSSGTPQHQNKQQLITSSHQQAQQVHYSSSGSGQYRNAHSNSPRSGDETYLSSAPQSSMSNAGHRFLQPRSNSTAAVRRNSSSSHPTVVTSTITTAVSTATGTFAYQPVLPISMADGSHTQGVTLPVQRIIEGLPVVTLPAGLVTHEPIVMTAAQRQLHEQLRVKHAQLQRQIMAQQEELRRVSEQLLLAQYGAWGPTVLKMAVPFSEGEGSSTTTTQPTHAVLSAGGLVTCLTTESPVGLAQATSPQLGSASGGQAVAFSPGTPILVHSPEIHAHSPPGSTEPLSVATDPSQVVFRTALQQDTLVQLSQQDVQMLLAQSLLQDNPSLSIEYLP